MLIAHEMAELFTDPYPHVTNGVAVCNDEQFYCSLLYGDTTISPQIWKMPQGFKHCKHSDEWIAL